MRTIAATGVIALALLGMAWMMPEILSAHGRHHSLASDTAREGKWWRSASHGWHKHYWHTGVYRDRRSVRHAGWHRHTMKTHAKHRHAVYARVWSSGPVYVKSSVRVSRPWCPLPRLRHILPPPPPLLRAF
ncbi:MAG: hypothetical protein AB1646_15785 [Thermodesulfobacteriota bacterium]